MRQKNMAMSPLVHRTKNDCAGKDQQQFPNLTSDKRNMVMSHSGPGTNSDCAGKGQQQFTQNQTSVSNGTGKRLSQ
jgi:hypothetical protein